MDNLAMMHKWKEEAMAVDMGAGVQWLARVQEAAVLGKCRP